MIHKLTENCIACEIPEGAKDFLVYKGTELSYEYETEMSETGNRTGWIGQETLPPGNWEILGRPDKLTASNKVDIVEKENDTSDHLRSWWYKEYIFNAWVKDVHVSFDGLLKSKNVSPDNVIILIKQ